MSGRTDPIFTRVDETNHRYRNETDDGHLLHDPQQTEECASFDNAPTREDIDDRCSYVERQVSEGGDGIISISTHGEGYNPIGISEGYLVHFPDLNEVGGIDIFYDVDIWVQEQLINVGVCPTQD